MTRIKTILIATDLSERSDRAMARALALAAERGASVTALSVLDDAMPPDLVVPLLARVQERLDEVPKTHDTSVAYSADVMRGDPTETILAEVAARKPDLLVLGTHRKRPFLDALRETTAQRIVRRTDASVLLVTEPADKAYEQIDLACDFSPAADAALALADAIAPQATLTPVHVVHIPYRGMLDQTPNHGEMLEKSFLAEARRYDAAWRKDASLPARLQPTEFPIGGAYSVLAERARSGDSRLIAAGAHGRVGAARAILGSLATDLMRDPPCDVLIARAGS